MKTLKFYDWGLQGAAPNLFKHMNLLKIPWTHLWIVTKMWFHMLFYGHERFGALWTTDLPVEEMQLLWVADIPVNVSPSLRLDLLSSNLIARPILRKIGLREIFWDWSFLCQILHPGANLYSRETAGMEYDDWQALGRERAFGYHNQLQIFSLGLRDP